MELKRNGMFNEGKITKLKDACDGKRYKMIAKTLELLSNSGDKKVKNYWLSLAALANIFFNLKVEAEKMSKLPMLPNAVKSFADVKNSSMINLGGRIGPEKFELLDDDIKLIKSYLDSINDCMKLEDGMPILEKDPTPYIGPILVIFDRSGTIEEKVISASGFELAKDVIAGVKAWGKMKEVILKSIKEALKEAKRSKGLLNRVKKKALKLVKR